MIEDKTDYELIRNSWIKAPLSISNDLVICNAVARAAAITGNKDDCRILLRHLITLTSQIQRFESKFEFDNLDLIKVLAKVEDLLEIKGNNLMQLIWNIGNRHIPCQIEKDRVLIQFDKVIGDMILRLGGKINQVKETFNPEGGAYGMGRTHGHKH